MEAGYGTHVRLMAGMAALTSFSGILSILNTSPHDMLGRVSSLSPSFPAGCSARALSPALARAAIPEGGAGWFAGGEKGFAGAAVGALAVGAGGLTG